MVIANLFIIDYNIYMLTSINIIFFDNIAYFTPGERRDIGQQVAYKT